jgi:hypothetical protein
MDLLLVIIDSKSELQFAKMRTYKSFSEAPPRMGLLISESNVYWFLLLFGRAKHYCQTLGRLLILHSSLCSLHLDFPTKSFLSQPRSVGSSSASIIRNGKY